MLRGISRRYSIPLSTLKLNARILRDLNLISASSPSSGVLLTPLGDFVSELLGLDHAVEESLNPRTVDLLSEKLGLARRYLLELASGSAGETPEIPHIASALVALYLREAGYQDSAPTANRLVVCRRYLPAVYASLAAVGLVGYEEVRKMSEIRSVNGLSVIEVPGITVALVTSNQCLPVGCGIALTLKREGVNSRVYVLSRARELSEGCTWGTLSLASRYRLDNLVVIACADERVEPSTLPIRLVSVGWRIIEVCCRRLSELARALDAAFMACGKPLAIIVHTDWDREAEHHASIGSVDEAGTS